MNRMQSLFAKLSAVRIMAWASFALIVLGSLGGGVGEPLLSPRTNFGMGTAMGDPRVVQRRFPQVENATTVAWITDSSPTILRAKGGHPDNFDRVGFIQDRILEKKPDIEGHPLHFAMYMQSFGPKAIDKYFEAQHAISLKPNLLIYGVNPTFDFTPWDMMGEASAPGALSPFGSHNSYKWTLLLASPAQLIQGQLIRFLPTVEMRFEIGKHFEVLRSWLDPFNFRAAAHPSSPVGWSMMRWRAHHTGLTQPFDPERTPSSQLVQLTAMQLMDLRDDSWGKQILRDLVADLRQSGTPALIYMIPVNLRAIDSDPVVAANFRSIEKWFSEFAAQNSGGGVTIAPQTPSRFLEGLLFFDISHLTAPDPFVDYLSNEIATHAKPQAN